MKQYTELNEIQIESIKIFKIKNLRKKAYLINSIFLLLSILLLISALSIYNLYSIEINKTDFYCKTLNSSVETIIGNSINYSIKWNVFYEAYHGSSKLINGKSIIIFITKDKNVKDQMLMKYNLTHKCIEKIEGEDSIFEWKNYEKIDILSKISIILFTSSITSFII